MASLLKDLEERDLKSDLTAIKKRAVLSLNNRLSMISASLVAKKGGVNAQDSLPESEVPYWESDDFRAQFRDEFSEKRVYFQSSQAHLHSGDPNDICCGCLATNFVVFFSADGTTKVEDVLASSLKDESTLENIIFRAKDFTERWTRRHGLKVQKKWNKEEKENYVQEWIKVHSNPNARVLSFDEMSRSITIDSNDDSGHAPTNEEMSRGAEPGLQNGGQVVQEPSKSAV